MNCIYCGKIHGKYCPEKAFRWQKGMDAGRAQFINLRRIWETLFGRKHRLG